MKRADIIAEVYDEQVLQAEGFDKAILGWDESRSRLVYSVSKCIEILKKDMSDEDAWEYFSFIVEGAYMGEKTPVWCHDEFFE